ncbi:MAG: DUF1223 domain-containing protein [Alphaproteobacteria bacterium]|nr:DUF1223 domain-containing protein [Alphaproteobacteria bacterium]
MKASSLIALAATLALIVAAAALLFPRGRAADAQTPPAPAQAGLVVVELFQSQGCSSCPPANANVNALAGRADVLALSFSVDYWDHLGWPDTFATPAYTQRQRAYARALGHRAPFTPQVVINGARDLVGQNSAELTRAIADAAPLQGPALSVSDGRALVPAGAAPDGGADLLLVRYDPNARDVPIARGENAGRTLPHRFIVRELTILGRWTGDALAAPIPVASESTLSSALILQAPDAGPILAAARL